MAINTYLLTITLNGLTALVKRHTAPEWITKEDPYTCCPWETHITLEDTHRLKIKGQKDIL